MKKNCKPIYAEEFANQNIIFLYDLFNIENDCNWTRTHNHLVGKRTLNHLAKLTRCKKRKKVLRESQSDTSNLV